MRKKLLFLCLLAMVPIFSFANYFASQIDYYYSEDSNRLYITATYWRLCNESQDRLVNNIKVEMPGCGSFTISATTSITDISLYKDRYPSKACVLANANNWTEGVEGFVSTASFALDTLPFKTAVGNGCCNIFFSAEIGFLRPSSITTGLNSKSYYNYASLNICNLRASGRKNVKSINYLLPPYTEKVECNNRVNIDFGAYGNGQDSVGFELSSPLGTSRTNALFPNGPLNTQVPLTPYCPGGVPCTPIPNARPPIGFYINPSTSAIVFNPTNCGEIGVTVIQGFQYLKDTNGVQKLVGVHRRDFMIRIVNGAYNNPPTLSGATEHIVFLGDSITLEAISKDGIVISHDPNKQQTADTTNLILNANVKGVRTYIKDSTVRERVGVFAFRADSNHLRNNPIVLSALAYDQDSLIPSRTMNSYRVYVVEKLVPTLVITPKPCGVVNVKLSISPQDYKKYKTIQNTLAISIDDWSKKFSLDTNGLDISLPKQGLFTLKLTGSDGRTFGFEAIDTFSYYQELIYIDETNTAVSYCNNNPVQMLSPKVNNFTSDSLKYEWFEDAKLVSTDTFLTLKNYKKLRLKVSSINCSYQIDYYVDSFRQKIRNRDTVMVCQSSCNTIHLAYYRKYEYFADSFYAKVQGFSDTNLVDNDTKYAACNVFNSSNTENRELLLYQRDKFSSCLYVDTLTIDFISNEIKLSDVSACANTGLLNLTKMTSNDSLLKISNGRFTFKNINLDKFLQVDSSVNPQKTTYLDLNKIQVGVHKIYFTHSKSACIIQDSAMITVLENEPVTLLKITDSICSGSGIYNLTSFVNADSGFAVLSVNGSMFTGNQQDYIVTNNFIADDSVGNYVLQYQRVNSFSCSSTAQFQFKVQPLPKFSFGPDIKANSFTIIDLTAPINMKKYRWNINGVVGNRFKMNAGDLNLSLGANQIICTVTDINGCEFSDTVGIDYSTSIHDLSLLGITIYPNPSLGIVTIEGSKLISTIKLLDRVGKEIPVEWKQSGIISMLDLHLLPKGEYILRLEVEGVVYYTKLLLL